MSIYTDLGTKVDHLYNMEDVIKEAKMDWDVSMRPLYTVNEIESENEGYEGYQIIQKAVKRAVVRRLDNGKEHILGIVGPNYTPVQNSDSFNFFQPFIDNGLACFESAGIIGEGERTWVQAKISDPDSEQVITHQEDGTPDICQGYALLSNAHDGSMSVRVGFVFRRVFCENSLNLALRDKASKLIKVTHSAKVIENLDKLRETMDLANKQFIATAEVYRELAKRQINAEDLKKFVKVVFSVEKLEEQFNESGDLDVEINEERKSRIIDSLENLFYNGKGNQGKTLWDAYNAVTEYNLYERGNSNTTPDYRLNATWFGDARRINERALKLATAML